MVFTLSFLRVIDKPAGIDDHDVKIVLGALVRHRQVIGLQLAHQHLAVVHVLEQPKVTMFILFFLSDLVFKIRQSKNETTAGGVSVYFFSNRLSTKPSLLNTCKSSAFSPKPMYLTGILKRSEMPITTPPLAVPSSLVTAAAFTPVAAVNCLACSKAFWRLEPSEDQQHFVRRVGNHLFSSRFSPW